MKSISFKFFCLMSTLWILANVQAQENFSSLGPTVSIPFGDFGDASGIGLGGNYQFEFGLTDKFALGTGIEAHYFLSKDLDVNGMKLKGQSTLVIPLKGYARFYLNQQADGLYAAVNLGYYSVYSLIYDEEGKADKVHSDYDFGWAPEIGFFITEGISLYGRYQLIYSTSKVYDIGSLKYVDEKQTINYLSLGANISF